MFELSLFPLNTVLFPGMPLQLHIFEERYKLMIGRCIEQRKPFGVVLIREGEAFATLPEPYMVGCTAQITQVQPVGQGRMNIVAIGQERFRVNSLNHDQPYLIGTVDLYPLENDDTAATSQLARRLRPLLERYLQLLTKLGQLRFESQQLPRDPLALAYLAAVLLRIPSAQQKALLALAISSEDMAGRPLTKLNDFTAQQQILLECPNTTSFLLSMCQIYRREILLLKALSSPPSTDEQTGTFSLS
jgi:Lon protease-like protein